MGWPADATRREWDRMLQVLALRPSGDDRFRADSYPQPGRIFGGQLVGQAVVAAGVSTDPDRLPSALHGTFLRTGDPDSPVDLSVDRLLDGRSFSSRRVDITQGSRLLFTAAVTFHRGEEGVDHQTDMPAVPPPEEFPSQIERLAGYDDPAARYWGRPRPVELRHLATPPYAEVAVDQVAEQSVWLRCGGGIPPGARLGAAVLGFVSDYTILEPVLRRHGLARVPSAGLRTASLNHSIWWHRPPLLDEWMLYVQASPSAHRGRGLSLGRMYGRAGTLIATVGQEGLYRTAA